MIEISIVIPMYNVAIYIERCLRSCFCQDLDKNKYEILIINDGSTDNSLQIANSIIKDYSNARIISQDNAGLSAARNTGIDNAKGRFLFFLDSDDWIAKNCLSKIVDKCNALDLDVLRICAANMIGDKAVRRNSYNENEVFRGVDVLKRGVVYCAPFSIFRRSFLNQYSLRFYTGIYHEDNEFTPRAYYFANRVSSLNDIFYYVYQNPESITRKPNPKKAFDIITVMESLREFSMSLEDEEKRIFDFHISASLNTGLNETYSMDSDSIKLLNQALNEHRHLFLHLMSSSSLKFKVEGVFFSLFPRHVVEIYHFLRLFDYRKLMN